MDDSKIMRDGEVYDFFDLVTNNNYYVDFANKLLSNKKQISFKYCDEKDLLMYNLAINKFAVAVNNADNKKDYSKEEIDTNVSNLYNYINNELKAIKKILNSDELDNEDSILEHEKKMIELQRNTYEFSKIYELRNNNEIKCILRENSNRKIFEFFKKLVENISNFREIKNSVDILNIFFIKLTTSDEDIRKSFLQQIINDKILSEKIFNNPNIIRYFIECFIKKNNSGYNSGYIQYINILNKLCLNNYKLSFQILISKIFNDEKYIKYNYDYRIFVKNILLTLLENLNNKDVGELASKIDDCEILRFFLLEKYNELNNKITRTEKENIIFNNINIIFGEYVKTGNNQLNTLTKLSINKLLKKKINIQKIVIYNSNIDELIDLIYLGIIEYNNISELNNEKLFKIIIDHIKKKIPNGILSTIDFILNENFAKFITNILNNTEKKDQFLDEIFSLFNNIFITFSFVADSTVYDEFLKYKEFIVNKFRGKIDDKYIKIIKLEKVLFDLNNASGEDIIFVEEFVKNLPNEYPNYMICYNGKNFCKLRDLNSVLFGYKEEKKPGCFNLIFENKKNSREFENYDEFVNFVNKISDKNLNEFKKFLDSYFEQFDKNNKIIFIKKTAGGSSGIIVQNSKNERFYIKIEDRTGNFYNVENVNILFGNNITPTMYTSKIDEDNVIIMTKGVGEQGLEDNRYDFRKEKNKNIIYYLDKIKNDAQYRYNFANSLSEIFIKGYLCCVVDIRRDNIRINKDGSLVLIDYLYQEEALDLFDCENICFFERDINQESFVENIFNNIFFKQQLFRHFNNTPRGDGTKQILKFLLEQIGEKQFEEILISQLRNCILQIKTNYEKNVDKISNQEEKKEFKKIYNNSLKGYIDLMSNIHKHYPNIYKKIFLKEDVSQEIKSKINENIFNSVIDKISDNNTKNELNYFNENRNYLSRKSFKKIKKITNNLQTFSIEEKNIFLKNTLCKSINLKNIRNIINKSISNKTCEVDILCDFSTKLIRQYAIEEEDKLKEKDRNDVNKLSEKFRLPNDNQNNLIMNFPNGDFKKLFNNGVNIIIEDINNNNKYNASFKLNKKDMNYNIINFITLIRTYGLVDACGICGIDIEIRNKNNEICNNLDIFNKKRIDEQSICELNTGLIDHLDCDIHNLKKALKDLNNISFIDKKQRYVS